MITTQKEFLSLLRKAKKRNPNIKWKFNGYMIRGYTRYLNLNGKTCCPGTFALDPFNPVRTDLFAYNYLNKDISSKLINRIIKAADNSEESYLRKQFIEILKPKDR